MDGFGLIDIASCDGMNIHRLVSSLDRNVSYSILEGFSQVLFDLGGRVLTGLSCSDDGPCLTITQTDLVEHNINAG